jgi:hypothetical protein
MFASLAGSAFGSCLAAAGMRDCPPMVIVTPPFSTLILKSTVIFPFLI